MTRIEMQEEGLSKLAKQVLSWIICAKRPLTTLELQHALAVEIGESKLDEEKLLPIENMISVCAGLVIVDNGSNILRLAHCAALEYFNRTLISWFPNAQRDIAKTCVTYLSFDAFKTGFCPTDEEFEARLRSNALYDYAARNWGHHVRTALIEEQLVLDFLESEAKVSASSQAMMASASYSGHSQRVLRQMMGVHLAAYFGLEEVIIALLMNGHDPDSEDNNGRTPLSWAAGNGYKAVVMLLLEKGIELESRDNYNRTLLSWAAGNGHEEVVKRLLEWGAELEPKDKDGRTSLSWAAVSGHEAVVEILLKWGAELESEDKDGRTPLSRAAENGQEAAVEILLKKGAELESKDKDGRTSLSWAAGNRQGAVVIFLLDKGAQQESKDNNGQTPLSWATASGHEVAVEILLKKGAKLESKDKGGQTPLSRAAENGREAVVKLLLEKDAELESKDNDGRTPLWWAAFNRHQVVVKLLSERDTVTLRMLAQKGFQELVKMLLAAGCNANALDSWNRTPLHHALLSENFEIARELISSTRIEVNSEDNDRITPLRLAIRQKQGEIIGLLLQKRAHTRGIMVNDWRAAFKEEPRNIVLLSEEQGGEKSVDFIAKETKLQHQLGKVPTEIRTLKIRLLYVIYFPYSKMSPDQIFKAYPRKKRT